MIDFEETVIGHRKPLSLVAIPDQWTALLLRDQAHASQVAATVMGRRPPEKGLVKVGGVDLYRPGADGIAPLFEKIGVVSHQGALLSNLSLGENIALPYQYRTLTTNHDAKAALRKLIDELGEGGAPVKEKLDWRVTELTNDERRLGELLRALLVKPEYFFLLNVTDDLGIEESLLYVEMLKRERRPWQGAFFLVAKENPVILDSMDVIHTL